MRPMRDLLEDHLGDEGLTAIREAQASITAKGGVVCDLVHVSSMLNGVFCLGIDHLVRIRVLSFAR